MRAPNEVIDAVRARLLDKIPALRGVDTYAVQMGQFPRAVLHYRRSPWEIAAGRWRKNHRVDVELIIASKSDVSGAYAEMAPLVESVRAALAPPNSVTLGGVVNNVILLADGPLEEGIQIGGQTYLAWLVELELGELQTST